MQDLRIYDFEFNLLAIETKVISSSWEFFFNDIGKAEIHISRNSEIIPALFDNRYLFITQGEKQAIVTAKQIGRDCVIYGRTPDWIISRRILTPFKSVLTGNAETLIRNLVKNYGFGTDSCFILGEKSGISDETEISVKDISCLSDVVKDTLSKCNAGRRVYLNIKNKKWVFEVLKERDNPLVICESLKNAYDTEYVFDLQNYFTEGYYNKIKDDGEGTQISSIEETAQTGMYKWQTPLLASYAVDAENEMLRYKIEENLKLNTRNLLYGEDYNLGDIVTVSIDTENLKRTKKYRIIGAELWNESGDEGQRPIFEEKEE
ncbi:MAG: hypothetical protein E7407_03740 [Ruminococcaceae bacterium]|nr:hypothetical protein [Oscillospiraceae bacterium]